MKSFGRYEKLHQAAYDLSLKDLHSLKDLEFKIEFRNYDYTLLKIELEDLPQTLEVLSLTSYSSKAYLKNLNSLSADEMGELNLSLLPSLEHLRINQHF